MHAITVEADFSAAHALSIAGIREPIHGHDWHVTARLEGPTLDDDGLLAFLQDKLGRHEIPREIEFRDELPKTMIGKLSKKELVAEEAARREGAA